MNESNRSDGLDPTLRSACGGNPDCETALRDLYQYLDGEMTEERCAHIRAHIEACGPCLEAFDFEADLRELVARTCRCEAPSSLRDRVAEAIRLCESEPGTLDPGS